MNNSIKTPSVQEVSQSSHPERYWERARAIMRSSLPSSQRLILLAISDHLSASEGSAWPSMERLAELTGYTVRTLHRQVRLMEVGGVLDVSRTGRANRYRVCWEVFMATPDKMSHQTCQDVTSDLSECHLRGDTVSPEVDKEQTKNKPEKKRRSKSRALSLDEVRAIPIPIDLQALEGYAERFAEWCEVRKGSSWRQTAKQVSRFHEKMAKAHSAGLDVLAGLDRAYEGGYQGLNASWLKPRASRTQPEDRPPGAPSEEWERVQAALLRWGRLPPGRPEDHPDHWKFRDDPAEERAFQRGICAAARQQDLTMAWMVLWEGGNEETVKWQRIRFENAFRKSMRGVA